MKKCTALLLVLGLVLPGSGAAFAKSVVTSDSPRKGRFEKCDTGDKGFLTQEEFANCYLRATARFEALDANRDGKVTKAEMKDAREAAKQTRKARAAQKKAKAE